MGIDQVTDGELAVLEVIWKRGDPTSRDIARAIYDDVSDSKTATVQKLLERLETKGCVDRDRTERAHRFRARSAARTSWRIGSGRWRNRSAKARSPP